MTVVEIKHLRPEERAEVKRLIRAMDEVAQLTPKELRDLAGKLIDETGPAKTEALKEQIISGFYGPNQDA